MLSEIFAVTDGEGLISSRLSRTAAIKDAAIRIAAFCRFSLLLGLFEVFSIFRRSGQVLLGDGWPLKTSAGLYRNALQQHEQLTMTASCGGGSDFAGSEYSIWGSMARQLMVQLHFLQRTTHAAGSPDEMPIMTDIV